MTGEPEAALAGLALCRRFFHEAVEPVVAGLCPGLGYSAGRIGGRSDALGYDDEISRDHGWGPGCTLLLPPEAYPALAAPLHAALAQELPVRFAGYSTSYRHWQLVDIAAPPVDHAVEITTVPGFLRANLGVEDPAQLGPLDWLAADQQKLLEVTAGALYRDDLGFARDRAALAFYPEDLRRHLMAVEWGRIGDEQAFPGRAGARGDEAGAALVAARLAESAMRLGFFLARRYPPYAKWFGTAFAGLGPVAAVLAEPLTALLTAPDWRARDGHWAAVLRGLIALHEQSGLLSAGRYQPAPVYLGRPGVGLPQFDRAGGPDALPRLIDELRAGIVDPTVRALPRHLGGINQLLASRDLEEDAARWRALYRAIAGTNAVDAKRDS